MVNIANSGLSGAKLRSIKRCYISSRVVPRLAEMKSIKLLVSLNLLCIDLVFFFFDFNSSSINKRAINHDLKDKSKLRLFITSCFISKTKHHLYLLKTVN